MSKIIAAALLSAFTLSFAFAPVAFDMASGTIAMSSAYAKHGADDVLPPQEPQPGDDRGGHGRP
jgi:hypothetical protein